MVLTDKTIVCKCDNLDCKSNEQGDCIGKTIRLDDNGCCMYRHLLK